MRPQWLALHHERPDRKTAAAPRSSEPPLHGQADLPRAAPAIRRGGAGRVAKLGAELKALARLEGQARAPAKLHRVALEGVVRAALQVVEKWTPKPVTQVGINAFAMELVQDQAVEHLRLLRGSQARRHSGGD